MIPLITVANRGYLELLINFYNTLKTVAPHRLNQLTVFTYDPELVKVIQNDHKELAEHTKFLRYPSLSVRSNYTLEGRPVVSEAISFGKGYWNLVTRYKLLAIWSLLSEPCNEGVFYCDPDIAFVRDPFDELSVNGQLQIQQGHPYCSGVMYVPNEREYQQLFDPIAWSKSKLNDEEYLTQQINALKLPISVLDLDIFPNGLVWSLPNKAEELISTKKCVLFHFNFIKTLNSKIEKMKELKLFPQ